MAYAANGNFADAITSVQTAIQLAEAAQLQDTAEMQKRLVLYQKQQPWRESFRATNAPAGR